MASASTYADVRICVVDDNRNFQNLFRTLLRGMGFRRVDVFADPIEARSFVRDTPIDIAFVDLVMPRQSGIEWVRDARRSTLLANPTMPITLVSGHVDRHVLDAAVAAGVDDVLVKPLAPSTLYHHTIRLLRRPHRYVRGPNGYFGPDLRGTIAEPETRAAEDLRHDDDHRARRLRRTVPGLHVDIRREPGHDAEQTFLD